MRRLLFPVLVVFLAVMGGIAHAAAVESTLAPDTPWATAVQVIDTGLPGPCVVVCGGVHGDEPAGAAAALGILDWDFVRGRVVVIPRVNTLGLERSTRLVPAGDGIKAKDLNRCFPTEAGEEPGHPLAAAIWELLEREDPDWVIDLHEGVRFRINEPASYHVLETSVGNSVITPPDPRSEIMARGMVRRVNATLAPGAVGFVMLRSYSRSRGQLYRAAHEPLDAHGLIMETVCNYQPLSRRVSQHHAMLRYLFENLGMLAGEE